MGRIALRVDADERHAGLAHEAVAHLADGFTAGRFQLGPQARRRAVAELVLVQVALEAAAHGVLADVVLQHLQDVAALVVGKAVEEIHRAGIAQVVLHRHGRRLQVQRDHALFDRRVVLPRVALELRVQRDLCDVLKPVGEGFVQPDVVPPVERHEVTKPLVRQLMRHHHERARLAH